MHSARAYSQIGWFIFFGVVFSEGAIASTEEKCSARFQLNALDQVGIGTVFVSVKEEGSNNVLPESGTLREFSASRPEALYRTIVVAAGTSDNRVPAGELAYFMVWPCEAVPTLTMAVTQRTGTASEVASLRDNKDYISPPDIPTAAAYLAEALGTAEARQRLYGSNFNQYNLIATYHALRAFYKYSEMAPIPLAYGERLARISVWHRKLLNGVPSLGMENIAAESRTLLLSRVPLSRMYKAVWGEILEKKEDRPQEARILFAKFRLSIEAEPEKDQILKDIGIDRVQMQRSENELSVRSLKSTDLVDAPNIELARDSLIATQELLRVLKGPALRAGLQSDANYLVQMIDAK